MAGSRTAKKKSGQKSRPKPARKAAEPALLARVNEQVMLEVYANGKVGAYVDGYAIELGNISPGSVKRAQGFGEGLEVASFSPARKPADKEIELLARRLARSGLLEYQLMPPRGGAVAAIEPQIPDYWPQVAKLANSDTVALSRFAYLRRRGNDLVLESPRAPALFRFTDPKLAAAILALSTPQKISALRREKNFVGLALLGLLVACDLLFKVDPKRDGLRVGEGDENLVLWDFHDLLFHTHSTEGRQANPLGGRYTYIGAIAPPAAVHAPWPGTPVDLPAPSLEPATPFATLLGERRSVREFDEARPITLAELAALLDTAARVRQKWSTPLDFGDGNVGPDLDFTSRPYPSAGSAYELELYLAVNNCEGLARGYYHYDADRHVLVPVEARAQELEALLSAASFAMDVAAPPQILVTIAARFNRVAWKYSAIAYSLILKDVGVLLQTLYLTATDMGLGGCAIGTSNVDLFARMTGQPFHVEGPVGQFALGRGAAGGEAG
ncbi:MAG TPA: SagB family peptide dehydrogenase [Steroidobacteraceae bacterium]|jgi:SagB-type dehydrogenase family enzyme|nr:SagB family peptide dehydrogenase [Steroidobacteraceae bacterium]